MKRFFTPGDSPKEYFNGICAALIGAALFMALAKLFVARGSLQPLTMLVVAGSFGAVAAAYAACLWRKWAAIVADELAVVAGKPESDVPKPKVAPFVAGSVPVVLALALLWLVQQVFRG
jgi:hypothetical protein